MLFRNLLKYKIHRNLCIERIYTWCASSQASIVMGTFKIFFIIGPLAHFENKFMDDEYNKFIVVVVKNGLKRYVYICVSKSWE